MLKCLYAAVNWAWVEQGKGSNGLIGHGKGSLIGLQPGTAGIAGRTAAAAMGSVMMVAGSIVGESGSIN